MIDSLIPSLRSLSFFSLSNWALIGFLVVVVRCCLIRVVIDVLACARRIVDARNCAVVDCCKLVDRTGNVVVRTRGDGIVDCVFEYVAVDCNRDVDANVGEVVVACCVFVGRCIDSTVCNVAVRRSVVGRRNVVDRSNVVGSSVVGSRNVVGCSNVVGRNRRRRRRLEDEVLLDVQLDAHELDNLNDIDDQLDVVAIHLDLDNQLVLGLRLELDDQSVHLDIDNQLVFDVHRDLDNQLLLDIHLELDDHIVHDNRRDLDDQIVLDTRLVLDDKLVLDLRLDLADQVVLDSRLELGNHHALDKHLDHCIGDYRTYLDDHFELLDYVAH